MKPLYPGQAAIARFDGRVCVVICDHPENVTLGDGRFDLEGELHQITIQGVRAGILRFVFILTPAVGEPQRYVGYVNELEEHVLESLATQPRLIVIIAGPDGKRFADSECENTLRPVAHFSLPMISELAGNKPWGPAHFAGAVAFIEAGGQ